MGTIDKYKGLTKADGGGSYALIEQLQKELPLTRGLYEADVDIKPLMTEQGMITSAGADYNSAGVLATWSRSGHIRYVGGGLKFKTKAIFGSNTNFLSIAFYDDRGIFISGYTAAQTATEILITPPAYTYTYKMSTQNSNYVTSYLKVYETVNVGNLLNDEGTKKLISLDKQLRDILGGFPISIAKDYNLLNDVLYTEPGLIKLDGTTYNSGGVDPSYTRTGLIKCYPGMEIKCNIINTQSTYAALCFYDYKVNPIISDYILGNAGETIKTVPLGACFYKLSWLNTNYFTRILTCNVLYTTKQSELFERKIQSIPVNPTLPPYIYTVCNDINILSKTSGYLNRSYSASIYLDRLFAFSTNIPIINFVETGTKQKFIFAPISAYNGTFNSVTTTANPSEPTTATVTPVAIEGDYSFTGSVINRSSAASNGKTSIVELLAIGDSITNKSGADYEAAVGDATVYWSWVKKLFDLDKIESGDNANDYNLNTIGAATTHAFAHTFLGVTKNNKCYAEGRSGWKVTDYYANEWYNNIINHYAGYNFFYDNVTYSASDCKFSMLSYLANYRTHTDAGIKLELGDPALGARIVSHSAYLLLSATDKFIYRDFDANWRVLTPTHVVFALGTNDTDTGTNTAAKILTLINRIKAEGFDIKFGVQMAAFSGTWWTTENDRYLSKDLQLDYTAALKSLDFNAAYMALGNSTDIFYLPSSYVQPTSASTTTRNIDQLDSFIDGYSKKLGVEFGNRANYHPNVKAHIAWAYQIYSWIKWTLG